MWLMEEKAFNAYRSVHERDFINFNSSQIESVITSQGSQYGGSGSDILSIEGSTAYIDVQGVLTQKPDFFAMLFGFANTTWSALNEAVAMAESDKRVTDVVFNIDSPGGEVYGMFDAMANISMMKKPKTAFVENLAASAAYGIASQADTIIAKNRASTVGSIGVLLTMYKDEDVVNITSTEAPNKRPDINTEEGVAAVRQELDDLHELFVEAIANGRSKSIGSTITIKDVNSDFGRGSVFLAEKALKNGMIDSILTTSTDLSKSRSDKSVNAESKTTKGVTMDLKTLKAEYSDLYEAVFQEGVAAERDRTVAHLIMGEKTGAISTAIKAVKEGSRMTETLQAEYMTAGLNKARTDARASDDVVAASALSGADDSIEVETMADKVAALIEQKAGLVA